MSPREAARVRQAAIDARREELLTPKEYAYLIGQHVESVRRRIRQGRQPGACRYGGQWRVDLAVAGTGPETS